MSIQDISEVAKMPVPTVKNAISGKRSVKPETLGRVAKAFKIDVMEILGNDESGG